MNLSWAYTITTWTDSVTYRCAISELFRPTFKVWLNNAFCDWLASQSDRDRLSNQKYRYRCYSADRWSADVRG